MRVFSFTLAWAYHAHAFSDILLVIFFNSVFTSGFISVTFYVFNIFF